MVADALTFEGWAKGEGRFDSLGSSRAGNFARSSETERSSDDISTRRISGAVGEEGWIYASIGGNEGGVSSKSSSSFGERMLSSGSAGTREARCACLGEDDNVDACCVVCAAEG